MTEIDAQQAEQEPNNASKKDDSSEHHKDTILEFKAQEESEEETDDLVGQAREQIQLESSAASTTSTTSSNDPNHIIDTEPLNANQSETRSEKECESDTSTRSSVIVDQVKETPQKDNTNPNKNDASNIHTNNDSGSGNVSGNGSINGNSRLKSTQMLWGKSAAVGKSPSQQSQPKAPSQQQSKPSTPAPPPPPQPTRQNRPNVILNRFASWKSKADAALQNSEVLRIAQKNIQETRIEVQKAAETLGIDLSIPHVSVPSVPEEPVAVSVPAEPVSVPEPVSQQSMGGADKGTDESGAEGSGGDGSGSTSVEEVVTKESTTVPKEDGNEKREDKKVSTPTISSKEDGNENENKQGTNRVKNLTSFLGTDRPTPKIDAKELDGEDDLSYDEGSRYGDLSTTSSIYVDDDDYEEEASIDSAMSSIVYHATSTGTKKTNDNKDKHVTRKKDDSIPVAPAQPTIEVTSKYTGRYTSILSSKPRPNNLLKHLQNKVRPQTPPRASVASASKSEQTASFNATKNQRPAPRSPNPEQRKPIVPGLTKGSYVMMLGQGMLGVNLKQTYLPNRGVYVDFLVPGGNAEKSTVVCIGDAILKVGNVDVSRGVIQTVPKVIAKSKRPVMMVFKGEQDLHWRKMDNIAVAVGMMNKIMEDSRRGIRNMPIRGESERSNIRGSPTSLLDKEDGTVEDEEEEKGDEDEDSDQDLKRIASWTTTPLTKRFADLNDTTSDKRQNAHALNPPLPPPELRKLLVDYSSQRFVQFAL